NKNAVTIPISQAPGSNALELGKNVRATMEELKKNFPDGVDYTIIYDTTEFVQQSIEAVFHTLLEAIALVVLVVILFLQTWRASIIPLVAVPVSVIGTFAVLLAFGFSINTLSLFGLVLAIGIVVDDAIVVVENVERHIEEGLSPLAASHRAIEGVSGPIIANSPLLSAVFVPVAFISGLDGQFYRQFALTIAFSTLISAFNSLTLSPALAALLLKPRGAAEDAPTRFMHKWLGWLFDPFNRLFGRASNRYGTVVTRVTHRSGIALAVYAVLVVVGIIGFSRVPKGFVPSQDKRYLVAIAQLPDAASLDRTEAVIRRMTDLALKTPGVEHAVEFPGLSITSFGPKSNAGVIFFGLKPFEERKSKDLKSNAILMALNQKFSAIQEGFVAVFPPPDVNGLGSIGGFKMMIEDKAGLGDSTLYANTQALIGRVFQTPGLGGAFSGFQINVPQLFADVDRDKVKQLGIPLNNVFSTLQIYLGSQYVN